jgi:beta-glucosidase
MEMVTTCYINNLATLVAKGSIKMEDIDQSVANVLRVKFRLDLFNNYYTDPKRQEILLNKAHLDAAKNTALEAAVLLQNKNSTLPLSKTIKNLAVIGPLADDGLNQLGCWIVDGRATDTHVPLKALQDALTHTIFHVAKGFTDCNAKDTSHFSEAITAAKKSDVVLMFMGESNDMSGENHSRANISFPGLQLDLITEISKLGKPIVLLVYAGRCILLNKVQPLVNSILYVWQLGTMAGPAIADLLLGVVNPSGKLPITFLREKGQIPLYYNKKNTGRPNPTHEYHSFTSCYLDIDSTCLYPFGFGLSYTTFAYSNMKLSKETIAFGETLIASALVKNTGSVVGAETSLLFVRDLVGSYTRPIRELKGFSKNTLKPGESYLVTFILSSDDLRFWTKSNEWKAEPGKFSVFIGPNAE